MDHPVGLDEIKPNVPTGLDDIKPSVPPELDQVGGGHGLLYRSVADVGNVPMSLIVGTLSGVSEPIARGFFGEEAAQKVQHLGDFAAPQTDLGKAILGGFSLPPSLLHAGIKKSLMAMGRDEETANNEATGVIGGLFLGGMLKGPLVGKSPFKSADPIAIQEWAKKQVERSKQLEEVAGKSASLEELEALANKLQNQNQHQPAVETPKPAEPTPALVTEPTTPTDLGGYHTSVNRGAPNPIVHPDWFEGLEPSARAKAVGSGLDMVDAMRADMDRLAERERAPMDFAEARDQMFQEIADSQTSGRDYAKWMADEIKDVEGEPTSAIIEASKVEPLKPSVIEASVKAAKEEAPSQPRTFIEPKPFEASTNSGISFADLTDSQLQERVANLQKDMLSAKDKAARAAIDESHIYQLEYDLKQSEYRSAQQEMMGRSVANYLKESTDALNDFPDLEDILAEQERISQPVDQLNGTPEQAVISTSALDSAPKQPENLRFNSKPAIRTPDGQVIEGPTHGQLIGELTAKGVTSNGVELGWVHEGNFTPESIYSRSTSPRGTVAKRKVGALGNLLDKLDDQSGAVFGKKSVNFDDVQLEKLRQYREAVPVIQQAAKSAGKSVEQFLRDNGLGEEAISAYTNLARLEIQTSEVMGKASRNQIRLGHIKAQELGLNLDDVKTSVGLVDQEGKVLSMAKMSYNQAALLNAKLDIIRAERLGETLTEAQLRKVFEADTVANPSLKKSIEIANRVGASKFKTSVRRIKEVVNSPEVALRETPIGAEIYRVIDRADMMMRRMNAYVFDKRGMNIDQMFKDIKRGSADSRALAEVLENFKPLSEANQKVRNAHKLSRTYYDFMLNKYVDTVTNGPTEAALVRDIIAKNPDIRYKIGEDRAAVQSVLNSYKKQFGLSNGAMKAMELLRSKEQFYMPHVWDTKSLIADLAEKVSILEHSKGAKTDAVKAQIERYKDTIRRVEGGELIMYSSLPKSIKFGHFEKRLGAQGYEVDAIMAFERYHYGILKKLYMEPALNRVRVLYEQLPSEYKPYAKQYLQDMFGWRERHYIPDFIKQLEYTRTLGFNLRSAINNGIGGSFNTISAAANHPIAFARGVVRAHTPDGIADFRATGAPREIAHFALDTIGESTKWSRNAVERFRLMSGAAFNAVEFMNRNVAYNVGREIAVRKGLTGDDLFFASMDFMHKTQFRYGKVGMPMGLRGWGGAMFQFSSYPIKQFEFMADIAKNAAKGDKGAMVQLATLLGLQIGATAASYRLGSDIAGAAGFGGLTTWEMLYALKNASQGDWEDAKRYFTAAAARGNGIFPNFPPLGPGVTSLMRIGASDDKLYNAVAKELEPVQAAKLREFITAIRYQKDGRYPIYKYQDFGQAVEGPLKMYGGLDFPAKKYDLDLPLLLLRTFGPKPSAETELQRADFMRRLQKGEAADILKKVEQALASGDAKELKRLFEQHPIQAVQGIQKFNAGQMLDARFRFTLNPQELEAVKGQIGKDAWISRETLGKEGE